MKVLKATKPNILKAAQIVKQGGTVIFPTDTVYGLGCDPLNPEAIKKILTIKGNRNKPFPVLASNLTEVNKIAFLSEHTKKIAAQFWPGPLTMVLPKKKVLSEVVTLGLDSVGVRVPNNEVALSLFGWSGGLLIGSSANLSGEKPPKSIPEMSEKLIKMVDVVLDGGIPVGGVPSTVLDLTSNEPKILREGPITLKQIMKIF